MDWREPASRRYISPTSRCRTAGSSATAPKTLVIHSAQAPAQQLPAVRSIIAKADAQQPISNVRTMEEVVGGETQSRSLQIRVLIIFTALAILLAGLGEFMGCCLSPFSLRQQEFGIRMALGAARADVSRLVLRQGAVLAGLSSVPGLLLALLNGGDCWRACSQA